MEQKKRLSKWDILAIAIALPVVIFIILVMVVLASVQMNTNKRRKEREKAAIAARETLYDQMKEYYGLERGQYSVTDESSPQKNGRGYYQFSVEIGDRMIKAGVSGNILSTNYFESEIQEMLREDFSKTITESGLLKDGESFDVQFFDVFQGAGREPKLFPAWINTAEMERFRSRTVADKEKWKSLEAVATIVIEGKEEPLAKESFSALKDDLFYVYRLRVFCNGKQYDYWLSEDRLETEE